MGKQQVIILGVVIGALLSSACAESLYLQRPAVVHLQKRGSIENADGLIRTILMRHGFNLYNSDCNSEASCHVIADKGDVRIYIDVYPGKDGFHKRQGVVNLSIRQSVIVNRDQKAYASVGVDADVAAIGKEMISRFNQKEH